MRTLTIEAKNAESANRLFAALAQFAPELIGDEQDGFHIVVDVSEEERILEVLNALERFANGEGSTSAQVKLD